MTTNLGLDAAYAALYPEGMPESLDAEETDRVLRVAAAIREAADVATVRTPGSLEPKAAVTTCLCGHRVVDHPYKFSRPGACEIEGCDCWTYRRADGPAHYYEWAENIIHEIGRKLGRVRIAVGAKPEPEVNSAVHETFGALGQIQSTIALAKNRTNELVDGVRDTIEAERTTVTDHLLELIDQTPNVHAKAIMAALDRIEDALSGPVSPRGGDSAFARAALENALAEVGLDQNVGPNGHGLSVLITHHQRNARAAGLLDGSLSATRKARRLREFAEYVVSLDDVDPASAGFEERRTVTLTELIAQAREALAPEAKTEQS